MLRSRSPVDQQTGFSLLELMLVVIIVGVLVMITITRVSQSNDVAKENTCRHNRNEINSALEQYAVSNGSLATAISDVDTTDYFPGGIPTCPVSGDPYVLNATTHRVEGHTNSGNH